MSGVAITADRAARTQFTTPYLDETLAFIVPDHRIADFSEWSQIRAMGPLRLGVPVVTSLVEKVREQLPEAVLVPVDRHGRHLHARNPPLDAAIATAERGSAYTILHPAYAVDVPKPRPFKVPLAYAIAGRDAPLTTMVNTWIELQRKDDTVDELFSHWILGENAVQHQPRWSVLRDVLHWVPLSGIAAHQSITTDARFFRATSFSMAADIFSLRLSIASMASPSIHDPSTRTRSSRVSAWMRPHN